MAGVIAQPLEQARRLITGIVHGLVRTRPIRSDEVDTLIGEALRKCAESLGAHIIAMVVLKRDNKTVSPKYVCSSSFAYEADDLKRQQIEEQTVALTILKFERNCIGKSVIQEGKPRINNCACNECTCLNDMLEKLDIPLTSILAVPVVNADLAKCDEYAGRCILAINKDRGHFTESDRELVETLCKYIARLLLKLYAPNTGPDRERETAELLAFLTHTEFIEIGPKFPLDSALLHAISQERLDKYCVLPLAKLPDGTLRVAISNPQDTLRIADFEICTGLHVSEKVVATSADITAALKRAFSEQSKVLKVAKQLAAEYDSQLISNPQQLVNEAELTQETSENSALIVNLANRIIEDAYAEGASDIHVEPLESKIAIRYRIDGICQQKLLLPKAAQAPLVARLKIMSDLNIAEHRLPQDGRIVFKKFSRRFDLDLRVSVIPTQHGESVVMRILDKTKSTLPLEKLGFSPYNLELYRKQLTIPYGMILHTGPTGSGKSMTLYAALNEVNSPEYKILTAEDPIEYTLPGIVQVHIRSDVGLTFASALRSFLRQDPDIILVGEIRDRETAEIAVEAALTGHILFSTLHTNDACSTITRLTDIGIEPFLISNTLACICAQRLVRRLCSCKTPAHPSPGELELVGRARNAGPVGQIFQKNGCERCGGSGYKGRTGIHELLAVTDELREMISRRASNEQLKAVARRNGMRTLFEDVMEKVKGGITSLPEALSTAQPDETAGSTTEGGGK